MPSTLTHKLGIDSENKMIYTHVYSNIIKDRLERIVSTDFTENEPLYRFLYEGSNKFFQSSILKGEDTFNLT